MKYLKIYELFNNKLEKGELILTNYTIDMKAIYLVLKCEKSIGDNWNIITAFFIGTITRKLGGDKFACLIFNAQKNEKCILYNPNYTFLSKDDKLMVCESIYSDNYKRYLDIIKEKIGIDLRESEDYKRYLIERDVKKFNL